MKPNNHEQSKRHTFDSFCKKILKHEARNYYNELKRQRNKEVSFSNVSANEIAQLYTEDKYFVTNQIFNVLGLDIIVTDDAIVKALQSYQNVSVISSCFPISLSYLTERLGTS